jgi:excisionase family DNA binding protein
MSQPNEKVLTIEQVASFLQVSTKTIRRLIKDDKLKASKVGRVWRIKHEDIETYLSMTSNK